MAENYGPFSAGAGASLLDAAWRSLLSSWFRDSVINDDNMLEVTAGTGMTVNVDTGHAIVHGLWYENTASKAVTISAADASNSRIDTIVVKADLAGQTIAATVHTGTAAASPVAPTLTQDSSTWEIALAQVLVPAGASSSASFTITDQRILADPLTSWVVSEAAGAPVDLITQIAGDATHQARLELGGWSSDLGGEVHIRGKHQDVVQDFFQTVPGYGSAENGSLIVGGQPSNGLRTKLGNMNVITGSGAGTAIAHGLGKTPDVVIPVPLGNAGAIWITNVTSTTFDIHMTNNVSWVAVAFKNG